MKQELLLFLRNNWILIILVSLAVASSKCAVAGTNGPTEKRASTSLSTGQEQISTGAIERTNKIQAPVTDL